MQVGHPILVRLLCLNRIFGVSLADPSVTLNRSQFRTMYLVLRISSQPYPGGPLTAPWTAPIFTFTRHRIHMLTADHTANRQRCALLYGEMPRTSLHDFIV